MEAVSERVGFGLHEEYNRRGRGNKRASGQGGKEQEHGKWQISTWFPKESDEKQNVTFVNLFLKHVKARLNKAVIKLEPSVNN